jgi:hypothetical protein
MLSKIATDQIIFRIVFFGFVYELVLMPVLIVLDLSYSFQIESNYWARFSYLTVFIFSFFYMLRSGMRYILPHYAAFFLLMSLGFLNGAIREGVDSTTLSHIFYYLMPPFAMNMGFNFGRIVQRDPVKLKYIFKFLYLLVWLSFVLVILHLFGKYLGLNSYNKLGLWALIFGFPLLLVNGKWTLGLIVAFFANKSSIIVVVLMTLLTSQYVKFKSRRKAHLIVVFFTIVITPMIMVFIIYQPDIFPVFANLYNGKIDIISSGRWGELISMLTVVSQDAITLFFGSGFGATFVPWIKSPEYVSHYTHLGNFTWLWVTGIFGYVILSWFLFRLMYKLFKISVKPDSTDLERYIFLVCTAILFLSNMGAVLANSVFCWIYLGWGYWVVANHNNKFVG